jgi:hypothetical protein
VNKAEEGSVPEGDHAGIAEQQIEAHRKDGQDEHLDHQAAQVGRRNSRQHRQQGNKHQGSPATARVRELLPALAHRVILHRGAPH